MLWLCCFANLWFCCESMHLEPPRTASTYVCEGEIEGEIGDTHDLPVLYFLQLENTNDEFEHILLTFSTL